MAAQLNRIQKTARAVARLDVLLSFAQVSVDNGYTRPVVDLNGKILLKESRHPVVETLLRRALCAERRAAGQGDDRVAIITGPNMAGKSTYMRQIALIVIMAQIGCFVPASYAEIGIVDSIFTRVGASDDLASGQSTFMVEMTEVAEIIKNATDKSLLILDEIGRGTSTYDGMSIARAVLEYAADKKALGAKTLFATHYHELTELESLIDGVKNYNIAVKKRGDDITFLRRIVRGGGGRQLRHRSGEAGWRAGQGGFTRETDFGRVGTGTAGFHAEGARQKTPGGAGSAVGPDPSKRDRGDGPSAAAGRQHTDAH